MMWADPKHLLLYTRLLSFYALAILSFLVGIWWGLALIRRYIGPLLLSNAVVLVTFTSLSFLSYSSFFLVCAALFLLTLLVERHHPLFRPQPVYYARLRTGLSLVAAIVLVSAALLARALP